VFLALGSPGDAELFSLPLEASWAAKHAGLSWQAALALVSVNLEKILGLPKSEDVVVWEGNPLQFGASVVLVLDKAGGVKEATCWPESQ
jgi:imidazolonepropionase-like amidohydrolase